MNAKIRNAQKLKVPHMLVLGEREEQAHTVSVRYRDGTQENGIELPAYIELLQKRISSKQLV
jgi:threonyl-tRNA synthetase